jgi:3-oxoacyl-[acyl-carrier-protein] synthase III
MSEQQPTVRPVSIVGTGSYLPRRVLTNHDLEAIVETSDEWILTRTGIRERRIAADDEFTSDMAAAAARNALDAAGVSVDAVDVILVATISPDMPFPSTACLVQKAIGATGALCLDLEAACSGFLYAMETARALIASGLYETALIIGAEKMSAIIDWQDRGTCVLFGDGAGACVLQSRAGRRGILACTADADGGLGDLLHMPGGGSRNPASHATVDARMHYLKMGGNTVFKHAVRCMCDAAALALAKAGITLDEIACIIPHQANMRIIQAIADRVGLPMDRFYINLDRVGNTTAATLPLALDEAIRTGRLQQGDLILFTVFGGGFTWGAAVLEL